MSVLQPVKEKLIRQMLVRGAIIILWLLSDVKQIVLCYIVPNIKI